jgi:erythromycin esterase-like protein
MDDFLAMLLRAFCPDSAVASQWENRTSRLQMQAIVNHTPAMTNKETVRDFQVWLHEFQQKRVSTEKALKSDIGKEKKGNDKKGGHLRQIDILCSWCSSFANKDKRFPHDVKDCFSKRKSEAANDTKAEKCEICDESDHATRGCPFGPSVKQLVQEAKAAEAKAKVPTTSTDASTGDDKVCI